MNLNVYIETQCIVAFHAVKYEAERLSSQVNSIQESLLSELLKSGDSQGAAHAHRCAFLEIC